MIIIDFKTKKEIEVNTPKDLKKLLIYANPKMLNFYKNQLAVLKPDIEVKGSGTGLKIYKKEIGE